MKKQLKHIYISREFFINFIISFLIFTFIFLINGIFKAIEIIIKGASFFSVVKVLIYFFLSSLPYIFPLTLLSSSTSVFSRLTHDREIQIFSFSGINPLILTKNLLIFAVLCSILLIYYNLFLFPSIKYQSRKTIYNLTAKNPIAFFQPKTIINDFPNFSIYIGDLSKNLNFTDLSIIQKSDKITLFIKAEEGKINYVPETNSIIFLMKNGFITSQASNKISKLDFSEYTFHIELPQSFSFKEPQKKLSELPLSQLKIKNNIDANIEINERISFGITPLIFIFLGTGIGMKLKNKSRVLCIGVAGATSLFFFLFLILGEIIAKKLNFSLFVYLPVLIFTFITYYLNRYSVR